MFEHIGILFFTKKKIKLKDSSLGNHLLCNHSAFFNGFSILTRENKRFILELKESWLIIRDQPYLNRNVTSASLYLLGGL